MQDERLACSPKQTSVALSVSLATVYNLINRGDLRAVKIGRATRIPLAEIERLLGLPGGVDPEAA